MTETRFSAAMNLIPIEEVRQIWRYDPITGHLYWRIQPCNPIPAGSRAGSLSEEGYIRITYKRQRYMAHWIVWALIKGEWPKGLLDHRDNDGANNRARNLREASVARNMANRRRGQGENLRGAHFRRNRGTWIAMLCKEYLGSFPTEEAAHEAYKQAAVAKYGEFARFD